MRMQSARTVVRTTRVPPTTQADLEVVAVAATETQGGVDLRAGLESTKTSSSLQPLTGAEVTRTIVGITTMSAPTTTAATPIAVAIMVSDQRPQAGPTTVNIRPAESDRPRHRPLPEWTMSDRDPEPLDWHTAPPAPPAPRPNYERLRGVDPKFFTPDVVRKIAEAYDGLNEYYDYSQGNRHHAANQHLSKWII